MTSANTHLNRSTSELLSDLKALVADCEQGATEAGDDDTTWLDAARAAIAKAELYIFNQQSLQGERP